MNTRSQLWENFLLRKSTASRNWVDMWKLPESETIGPAFNYNNANFQAADARMAFSIGNLVGEAVIKRSTIEDVKFICGSLSAASFQVRRQGDTDVPTMIGLLREFTAHYLSYSPNPTFPNIFKTFSYFTLSQRKDASNHQPYFSGLKVFVSSACSKWFLNLYMG